MRMIHYHQIGGLSDGHNHVIIMNMKCRRVCESNIVWCFPLWCTDREWLWEVLKKFATCSKSLCQPPQPPAIPFCNNFQGQSVTKSIPEILNGTFKSFPVAIKFGYFLQSGKLIFIPSFPFLPNSNSSTRYQYMHNVAEKATWASGKYLSNSPSKVLRCETESEAVGIFVFFIALQCCISNRYLSISPSECLRPSWK